MSAAWPWAAAIPFVALLVWLWRSRKIAAPRGVVAPAFSVIHGLPRSPRLALRLPVLAVLITLFIFTLTLAALRPQLLDTPPDKRDARNLVLALDISKSMTIQDFRGIHGERRARIDGVKSVIAQFVSARAGDRLSVVVFGSRAYVQVPLTFDHTLVRGMVEGLQVGTAGDGTAIGDGLGVSLKRLEGIPQEARAVILITDGVNNSGSLEPLQAARVAAQLGVKVYAIGIGSNGVVPAAVPDLLLGAWPQRGEFDEQTLKEIASLTGGSYFNASDLSGLSQVYATIDKLERSASEEPQPTVTEEQFVKFVPWALTLYTLLIALSRSVFRRVP